MSNYSELMAECESINKYLGTSGVLEALMYIQAHEDEFEGTLVHRQFRAFMREGAKLFAPVGE
jgi:hypothetical protein